MYFKQQRLTTAIDLGLLPITADSRMLASEILAEILSVIESKKREIKQLSDSIRSDAGALRMSEGMPQVAGAYYSILQSMREKQGQVALLRGHIGVLWAAIPWHRRIGIGLARIPRLFHGTEGG